MWTFWPLFDHFCLVIGQIMNILVAFWTFLLSIGQIMNILVAFWPFLLSNWSNYEHFGRFLNNFGQFLNIFCLVIGQILNILVTFWPILVTFWTFLWTFWSNNGVRATQKSLYGAFGGIHNSFKGASINYILIQKGHSYNKVFTGAFINKWGFYLSCFHSN